MDKPIQTNPQVEAANSPAWQPLTFARIAFRLRHTSGDERLFGVSLALLALHLADAAVQGQGLGHVSYPLFPLVALILMPAFFALFVSNDRIIRTVLAAALGLIAVFYGAAVNISHILITGAGGSDTPAFCSRSPALFWSAWLFVSACADSAGLFKQLRSCYFSSL